MKASESQQTALEKAFAEIRESEHELRRIVERMRNENLALRAEIDRRSHRPPRRTMGLASTLADRERTLIESALNESRGRISGPRGAATKLGVPRQTLESKIKVLQIDKLAFRRR